MVLWNLLDSCGGGIAYWACGYAFAYGGDLQYGPKTFVGNTNFFLMNNDVSYEFWFFQFAFACALSSIVAGTIAERTQMKAYLMFSFFLVGFVYPVVSYVSVIFCVSRLLLSFVTDQYVAALFRSRTLSGPTMAFCLSLPWTHSLVQVS